MQDVHRQYAIRLARCMYDSMSQDSSIVLLDLDQTGPSQGTPSDYAERDPKASSTGLYYK